MCSSTTVFNIDNKKSASANQHIRIISEGSCDTEDWRNDAENSALHHRNKLHFQIYYNRKQLFQIVIIFYNITVFYSIFDQINTALSIKLILKH